MKVYTSDLKEWYSATELVGLPGLYENKQGVLRLAKRERWETRSRSGRGGGNEYRFRSLPEETRRHLIDDAAPAAAPEPAALPAPAGKAVVPIGDPDHPGRLAGWQRKRLYARQAILNYIDRRADDIGLNAAIDELIDHAETLRLPPDLQRLLPVAKGKRSSNSTLGRKTIYRWRADRNKGEIALAPKATDRSSMPDWATLFLKLRNRPQKPGVPWVLRQMAKELPPEKMPSEKQARKFLKRMGNVEAQRGRMGPRELANIRPHKRRDTSMLWPTEEYEMDGHTFDAEVVNFLTGKPCRPEITTVVDVATRRIVGWSVDLSERTWAVLDALRHACCNGGIPSELLVDNGCGYKNVIMADETCGVIARLGITMRHTRPYNSKGKGIVERVNRSVWVRAAKELPTYMGKDMDPEAKKQVYQRTRQDLATAGVSPLLMSWRQFVEFAEQKAEEYNHRPHRGLPKIIDPETGKRRHETPMEAWARAEREGWEPDLPTPEQQDDMCRPYELRKVLRGQVTIGTNRYFSHELTEWHGEHVKVGYDIHDASRVWVRDKEDDRLICIAEFEANKVDYRPVSAREEAARKRARARQKRLERKLEEIQMEANGGRPVIEPQPLTPEDKATANEVLARLIPSDEERAEAAPIARIPQSDGSGQFNDDMSFYRWAIMQPPERLSAEQAALLAKLKVSGIFQYQLDMEKSRTG